MRGIQVFTNFADLIAQVDRTRLDQLPQAMAWAMNASIDKAKAGVVDEMERVFDRPTPYTLNSVYGQYATKRRLIAVLRLKDNFAGDTALPGAVNKGTAAAVYLKPQIEGGARQLKRMEQVLRRAGLLPSGLFAVPGRDCPTDAYGNVPASFIVRMLSDLRAFGENGFRANRKAGSRTRARASNYFFAVPDPRSKRKNAHLKPGIYWHARGTLFAIFHFVRSVQYRARFDFYGVSEKLAVAEFRNQFPIAWRRALATDRSRAPRLAAA